VEREPRSIEATDRGSSFLPRAAPVTKEPSLGHVCAAAQNDNRHTDSLRMQ
jgi:hypothetical protein